MKKLIFTFALVAGLSGLGFVNASYAANCSTGTDEVSAPSSSDGSATKSTENNKNNRVSTPSDEG